jgi:uncharacterized protein
MRRFDLRSLKFGEASETWRRLPVDVAPFVFGGLDYAVSGDAVDMLLTAGRVGDRLTLTADFETDVTGPCQRCLEDAVVHVAPHGLDYVRHGDSDGADEGEAYASGFSLDVEHWARDLIADELPQQLLCRDDCRGLCAVCGVDLNTHPDHTHGEEQQ